MKKRAGHTSRKSLASTTMIVTGIWLLLFVVIHLKTFKFGPWYETPDGHARPVAAGARGLPRAAARGLLRAEHGGRRPAPAARAVERVPVAGARASALQRPRSAAPAWRVAIVMGARLRADPGRHLLPGAGRDARREDSGRPDRRQVGPAQVRDEAGEPGQQAQVHHHRRRHRPGRRVGGGVARRAGLQRPGVLHPRLARAAPTASRRRAASTPPRTTATTATASSACSTTRSRAATTAPARPTSTGWRRLSVNIIDQCVAQGVPFAREYGGAARQPLVRRRPGLAHVLRARPDRPAAAARRLSVADAAGRGRHGDAVPATARCSTSCSSTARRAASSCATW